MGCVEKMNEITKIIPVGRGMLRSLIRVCQGDLPADLSKHTLRKHSSLARECRCGVTQRTHDGVFALDRVPTTTGSHASPGWPERRALRTRDVLETACV